MNTQTHKLTYRDYLAYPDDGKRHEIVDRLQHQVHQFRMDTERFLLGKHQYKESIHRDLIVCGYLDHKITVDLNQVW